MKPHSEETRQQTLKLLQENRGPKEISSRLGISLGSIEDWASEWRKQGKLAVYKRPGMEYANRAKSLSNGYYPSIRKRYLGMKWNDHVTGRTFGFVSPVEAVGYYLDDCGNPRPCAYCGIAPPEGKVWGLDRLDSEQGHIPGNLVPCCSDNPESTQLSCQSSKSKFTLVAWMTANMCRAYGKPLPAQVVTNRLVDILALAKTLAEKGHQHGRHSGILSYTD